jgi:IS605 OrfB family transposase
MVERGGTQARHRAHVARLYPTPAQLQKLDRQGHTARALWNLLHEWHSWGGRGGPQSHRERDAYRQVATLRARQTRRRTDWVHKATTQVARSYGTIVVEDLNIAGMTRSARGIAECPGRNVRAKAGLNRAVLGMSWGRIQLLLAYKAAAQGGRLVKVAAQYSSQTCAECGGYGRLDVEPPPLGGL